MAKNVLADLVLRLTANSAELEKGLAKANKSLTGLEKNTKNIGGQIIGAFAKVGAAVGAAAGVFKFLKSSMEAIEGPGDKLAATIGGAKGALFELQRAIVTLDFSNLINGLIEGFKRGKEFSEAMDELADKAAYNDYKIAQLRRESAKEALKIADKTLSIGERQDAAAKRLSIEEKIRDRTVDLAKEEFNILKLNWSQKNKVSADGALKMYETIDNWSSKEKDVMSKTFEEVEKAMGGWKNLQGVANLVMSRTGFSKASVELYQQYINMLRSGEADILPKLFTLYKNIAETEAKANEELRSATAQNANLLNKEAKELDKIKTVEEARLENARIKAQLDARNAKYTPKVKDVGGLPAIPTVSTAPVLEGLQNAPEQTEKVDALSGALYRLIDTTSLFNSLPDPFEFLSNSIDKLTSSLSQGANSFKEYGRSVLSTIKDIIAGFFAESVAAMIANAIKNAAKAGPFALVLAPILAAAGAGLVKTAFNSLMPSFATGGLAYGPTMGLVGEYAGAKSNPEVIAPLSELKDLIGDSWGGEVKFVIEQNQLVGILQKANNKNIYF